MSGRNRKCGNWFRAKVYLTVEKGSETHRLPNMLCLPFALSLASARSLPQLPELPKPTIRPQTQGLSGRRGWVHIGRLGGTPSQANLPCPGKLIPSLGSLPAQQMPPFNGDLGDFTPGWSLAL